MRCIRHVLSILVVLTAMSDSTLAGGRTPVKDFLLSVGDLDSIQDLTAPSHLAFSHLLGPGGPPEANLLAKVGDLNKVDILHTDDQRKISKSTKSDDLAKVRDLLKIGDLANVGDLFKVTEQIKVNKKSEAIDQIKTSDPAKNKDLNKSSQPSAADDLAEVSDLTVQVSDLKSDRGGRPVGGSGRTLPAGLIQQANPYETWSSYHQRLEGDRRQRLTRQRRSADTPHSRQKRYLTFPTGSILYLEPNVYLPIYRSRQLSYFLELPIKLRWKLPDNTNTSILLGLARDRGGVFEVASRALDKFGMDGRACLLRAICEVAAYPMENEGLFGEIMNIVLSASRGPDDDPGLDQYVAAEYQGRSQGDCHATYPACPVSLFNLI